MGSSTVEEKSREIIARVFDAWRDRTGGPYDLLGDVVERTITNSVAAKIYPSREAFMSGVIRLFNARKRTHLASTVRKALCP